MIYVDVTRRRYMLIRRIWQWIGHMLRKPSDNITRIALRWTPEGKRKPCRTKNTWRRTVEKEMKEHKFTWGELKKLAQDRDKWRSLVLVLCAPGIASTRLPLSSENEENGLQTVAKMRHFYTQTNLLQIEVE